MKEIQVVVKHKYLNSVAQFLFRIGDKGEEMKCGKAFEVGIKQAMKRLGVTNEDYIEIKTHEITNL